MEKSCIFNPYELVVYLEKYFVARVAVHLHSNGYNRCRYTDESTAELSVLQSGNCRSVCLFVQFSFSPVVTGRYLQALTCKMPPKSVFPSDTLRLCRSVEYTSQHTGTLAECKQFYRFSADFYYSCDTRLMDCFHLVLCRLQTEKRTDSVMDA